VKLLLPLAVGAAVYLLSKKGEAASEANPEAAADPAATLGGADGAARDAAGAPNTIFPIVGTGGAAGVVAVAATTTAPACCPRKPNSATQTFTPVTRVRRTGSASETQSNLQAAIRGIAPDLRI
jgi:hypothetical protein